VHDTFWNSLAIEMGQKIDQMEVLKQKRAILANSLGGQRVHYRASIGRSVDWRVLVLWIGSHDDIVVGVRLIGGDSGSTKAVNCDSYDVGEAII